MKSVAAGFRVHSGWAAMVAVRVEKGKPQVLARERVHLVETFTYRFRQPYHTAEKLPPAEGQEFVERVEKEAGQLAHRAFHKLQSDLQRQDLQLTRCSLLLASGRTLPSFEKILASHALIHTADGELFRDALSLAGTRCAIEMVGIKERELLDCAKQALRVQPAVLLRRVTELGKPFGSPWSQDEKYATLAAWLALISPNTVSTSQREKQRAKS